MIRSRILVALRGLAGLVLAGPALVAAQAEVRLAKTEDGWTLIRGGAPHRIRGAGGTAPLAMLADLGANSTRTWGLDQLESGRLDEAQRAGLSVAVGIWLRHDLDYTDPAQVSDQIRLALEGVRKYKGHSAVLLWGIGNEMEGAGDDPAVWQHVEELAKRIKEEDPSHPTMTVIAEIGGEKVRNINRFCPSIDIVGINAYGGAASIPERYRTAGGTKPYILAEYGPRGPWDLPRNKFGSVDEESGMVKAATYLASFQAADADRELCLGSYAFKWGHKQEATPTWFGMLLADGRRTPAVDVMAEAWTGMPVRNPCPRIEALKLSGSDTVKTGSTVKATLRARHPAGKAFKVRWVLMDDVKRHLTGGYFQEEPPSYPDHILEASPSEAIVRVPQTPGLYRIFAYVFDEDDGADVANVLFRAEE